MADARLTALRGLNEVFGQGGYSNLVLEAVRLGAGVALERRSLVAGAIARGELVQLTAVTVPYPWHYWLTVSPQAENRPEVARFIAWLEEEIALWRQQISA